MAQFWLAAEMLMLDCKQLPARNIGHLQIGCSAHESLMLLPCMCAGNEFCERLAYYGLATNLVTYLTHIMGVDAAAAAVQVGTWCALVGGCRQQREGGEWAARCSAAACTHRGTVDTC